MNAAIIQKLAKASKVPPQGKQSRDWTESLRLHPPGITTQAIKRLALVEKDSEKFSQMTTTGMIPESTFTVSRSTGSSSSNVGVKLWHHRRSDIVVLRSFVAHKAEEIEKEKALIAQEQSKASSSYTGELNLGGQSASLALRAQPNPTDKDEEHAFAQHRLSLKSFAKSMAEL